MYSSGFIFREVVLTVCVGLSKKYASKRWASYKNLRKLWQNHGNWSLNIGQYVNSIIQTQKIRHIIWELSMHLLMFLAITLHLGFRKLQTKKGSS